MSSLARRYRDHSGYARSFRPDSGIERVLLMSNGRIVAEGPKERMLEPERLETVFGIKLEVARHDGYYHLW
jgi:ABC-type cobalamin transport system ATPase subunit